MSRRAAYPNAIAWLAFNDDCAWLDDDDQNLSVSACLVCDLFKRSPRELTADLRKFMEQEGLSHG